MFDETKFREFWVEVSKHGTMLSVEQAVQIARENYAVAVQHFDPDLNVYLNDIPFDQDVAYCLFDQLIK